MPEMLARTASSPVRNRRRSDVRELHSKRRRRCRLKMETLESRDLLASGFSASLDYSMTTSVSFDPYYNVTEFIDGEYVTKRVSPQQGCDPKFRSLASQTLARWDAIRDG